MKGMLLLISLSILSPSVAFSAQCKLGPEAYGASSGSSPKVEPPAVTAVIPAKCNKIPCNIEIPLPDLLPPPPENKTYEIVRIEEKEGKETRVISLVDKDQEKAAAKEASEKAAKEADVAAKEADRQEKEAADAQAKADRAAQEAASPEEAAEAERKAAEEQQEAEAARKEADQKAAEAQEAKSDDAPPSEDDGGGMSDEDNIRPLNDVPDPEAEAEAKKKKEKEAYTQGKGKLDCSNPKVQCVNSDLPATDPTNALQISVPINKNGVDCRYSRCDGEMDLVTVDKANSLVNQANDICRYSECMNDPLETERAKDDCGRLGQIPSPIKIPIKLDRAIIGALKDGGLSAVKIDKKTSPISPRKSPPLPLHP